MENAIEITRRVRIETAFAIARVLVSDDLWYANAAWCDECESYVPMLPALTAARLENTTDEAILSRVNAKELHQRATSDGLLVCLSSLLDKGGHSETGC